MKVKALLDANILFLGSIIIFVTTFITSNFIYDSYSVTRVLVTVLFSYIILVKLILKPSYFQFFSTYKNIFILLFLYAFIQSLFSSYIFTEFEYLQQSYISISYILVIITFLVLKNEKYSLHSYLSFIAWISVLYILFFLFSFLKDNLSIYDSISHYFKNIRFLNHLQTIIIPSLGLAILLYKKESHRIVFTLLLILNFMLLFETGGRGSFYSVLIAYIIFYLTNLNAKRVKENILFLFSIFLISLLLYISIRAIFIDVSVDNHILNLSSSGRSLIYKTVFPMIFETNYFISAIGFSSQSELFYGYLHPHNLFLYMFLGVGSVGLFVFISSVFYYSFNILTEYFKTQNIVKKYLAIIFLAEFIHSLVSGLYITPLTSLLLLYQLLMLKNYYLQDKKIIISSFKRRVNILVSVVIIFLSLLLSYKNYMMIKNYNYPSDYKEKRWYRPGIVLFSDLVFISQQNR